MTYKGAIDEVKSLANNSLMPVFFKPSLKKIAEMLEMERSKELTLSEVETYANEHNYVLWTEEMSEKALALIRADRDRPKGEWIPIEVRPLTEEEKEYYTEHEYPVDFMMMYDCPMPDDGQEVLITTSTGYVTTDTYYIDEGGYFENYCDEGDVKAWQPLPKPYKSESEE